MRIRMITNYAGPKGVIPAEKVLELPEEEAVPLLEGGFAEPVRLTDVEKALRKQGEKEISIPADVRARTSTDLEELEGVGLKRVDDLQEIGIDSVETLANAEISALKKIHGVGEVAAKMLINQAKEHLEG